MLVVIFGFKQFSYCWNIFLWANHCIFFVCGLRNFKLSNSFFKKDLFYFLKCCFGISLIKVRKFIPILFIWEFVLICRKTRSIVCLKEIDSVQPFIYLGSVVWNWRNWKLKIYNRNMASEIFSSERTENRNSGNVSYNIRLLHHKIWDPSSKIWF